MSLPKSKLGFNGTWPMAVGGMIGGGVLTFLREINAEGFAGSLSWVLIAGYVLTHAVYAFTFGQYLGHIVGFGPWFPRVTGITRWLRMSSCQPH
jgi:hypothetical protein